MQVHDVVVIGGGHNGLACAAYLARAGMDVRVLERFKNALGNLFTRLFLAIVQTGKHPVRLSEDVIRQVEAAALHESCESVRLHLTVSPEHIGRFRDLLAEVQGLGLADHRAGHLAGYLAQLALIGIERTRLVVLLGDALGERFRDHLEQYGHTIYDLDFADPVPADDPAPLLDTVKLFLAGQGADPYRTFIFKNTGTEPLVIKHAKGSCGCGARCWGCTPDVVCRLQSNRAQGSREASGHQGGL